MHYRQLKEKGLLSTFADNVKKLWNAGASITVEMVPEDELIPLIEEVKNFVWSISVRYRISVWQEMKDLKISEDCQNIVSRNTGKLWGAFDSNLFEFKMNHFESQSGRECKPECGR